MQATNMNAHTDSIRSWIPLSTSIAFLFRYKRLFGLSLLLVLFTALLTWAGFSTSLHYLNQLTADFFFSAPATDSILGWVKYGGWYVAKFLYALISHLIAFYLSFLLAFSLTTPGYVFLSNATEDKRLGRTASEAITLKTITRDLVEGIKIGAFGLLVTVVSLFLGFIPVIGHAAVFVLYSYYSALMFLDYPTSDRGWSLGKKLGWLKRHGTASFRIGFLPALVGMIPVLNIFVMALLFPVLTVHTTLNFLEIETSRP